MITFLWISTFGIGIPTYRAFSVVEHDSSSAFMISVVMLLFVIISFVILNVIEHSVV